MLSIKSLITLNAVYYILHRTSATCTDFSLCPWANKLDLDYKGSKAAQCVNTCRLLLTEMS